MIQRWRRALGILLVLSATANARSNNTVLGYSGLLLTPTAQQPAEGELAFGICRIPKLYADNYRPYDRTVFFIDMGFASVIEGSFAFVRPDNFTGGVGDRTVSLRLQLMRQSGYRPALSVGFHDFFAVKNLDIEPVDAQHFTSAYIVASHQLLLPTLWTMSIVLNAGYGLDWLPSNDRYLNGLFVGIAFSPLPFCDLVWEHDSLHANGGVRFRFSDRIEYMFSFWQMRYMMHHLSYSFSLM